MGNIDAYVSAVQRMPMLELEQERNLARRLRDHNDLQAAGELVMSHLRLVVSVSRQYLGYGLPQADLIQEGNIGLMKAVRRFDPDQGVRLVSYALHWIRAEMQEHVVRNWRMVRTATTKAQRKLFFGLRSRRQKLIEQGAMSGEHLHESGSLTSDQVRAIAADLQVEEADVREMEVRLGGGDIPLDPFDELDEGHSAPSLRLSDLRDEPTQVLSRIARDRLSTEGIAGALDILDDRSRRIIEARWIQVNDEGQGAMLKDMAAEFGVSVERIRQIEAQALRKMREHMGANSSML